MLAALTIQTSVQVTKAASFDGAARLSIADTAQSLTWLNTTPALAVTCWVKFSVPTGVAITENMMILADRNTGTWTNNQLNETHSYAIYLSATTGNIEFSSRGPGGYFTKTLVGKPFLERWYHLAVVRSGSSIVGYVDARKMFSDGISVGDSRSTDGVSIGGIGSGMFLRGEVQEVQVFRTALNQSIISDNRFADLVPEDWTSLRGYYKLGYSANAANQLKNFATSPGVGTDPAIKSGTGNVAFEETSRDGEQSLFDSTKNGGSDSIAPLAGGFDWSQTILSRPTPGVPFDFSIKYSSGNAFNKVPLEDFDPFSPSALGSGWRHTYEIRVLPNLAFNPGGTKQALGLMLADGSIETWDYADSVGGKSIYKTRHKEYRGELEFIGSGPSDPTAIVRWITPERLIYVFRSPNLSGATSGRLKEIQDLNGNRLVVELHETGEKAGLVRTVTDNSGGVWTLNYDVQNRLQSLTGLGWTVSFTYDANNRLSGRSLNGPGDYVIPPSTTWGFLYSTAEPAGLLYRVNNPRGLRDIEVTYDKYGRKTSERDGVDRITTFQYNVPALRQMTTTRQAAASPNATNDRASVDTYDRKLRVIRHKDPMGFVTGYEYDDSGNLTAATDAKGNRTEMTYDSRANVLTATDPVGRTTRNEYNHVLAGGIPHNEPTKEIRPATEEAPSGWENRFSYDAAGNLLTHVDDIGTLAEHTYDSRGLVISSKDANRNETRFGYDANGFLNSRTIAHGSPQAATWNFVRSELGWPLQEVNPLAQPTQIAYNLYGQVVRTEDAIGRIFTKTYDANGNVTEESDGNTLLTNYQYNNADERIKVTDRLNNVWDYAFNAFGELTTTTSPSVFSDGVTQRDTLTNAYDANGRLVKITDPYNDFVSFEYDANGNQTATIDKLGKRWEKDYDALDRVVAERDPDGNIKRVNFDAAGRVKVVNTPNGHPSTHEYDGRSRLWKWTDAEGYRWIYTYDGVGNILDIEDALGGHYKMSYGPRNERLTELNQDMKSWAYTYDSLVRLQTQLDPNGTHRTLGYDEVGRLTSIQFQTGRINSLGYDNNNNVVSVIRTQPGSPSTALYLAYDALDRLAETRDAFSKTVRYSYDALSRIRTKTYPGGKVLTHTYDRLGRLKGLSFAYSATQTHACSFNYDKAGRLTSRTYPNGIIQNNGFDNSGRITSLDYKTSGGSSLIALGYAYDRNGNKVGGSEHGTLDWQAAATPNYDEKSRFTAAGKLIDRTDEELPVPKVMSYTYDDSGNMTQASAPGENYLLAYDEDNRTRSIHWENGLTSKDILNRYDALGRRVSRKADGIETRYVLDLVGGMERILCDSDSSGNIQAWYVHGADLCFKVANTGTLACYHSDAMGNVVRTTNASATTVNQYAYTPYGRSLDTADSATDSDPYRFVGSQGVMLEMPGLYFMRARYYSAESGVFLATDPVKNIGPGGKSEPYSYANLSPLGNVDPNGLTAIQIGAGMGIRISIKNIVNFELTSGVGLAFESDALSAGDDENAMGEYYQFRSKFDWGAKETSIGITGPFDFKKSNTGYGVNSLEKQTGSFTYIRSAGEKSLQLRQMHEGDSVLLRKATDPPLTANMNPLDRLLLNTAKSINTAISAGKSSNIGTSGSSKSLSSKATQAASHATTVNQSVATKPAIPTIKSKSGGTGSSVVSTAKTTASSVVKAATSTVSKAISTTVSKIVRLVNKISSLFKKK